MAPATPDKRVADAINRVLDAERETSAAIVAAQASAQAAIEAAREQRRRILETARRRVVDMHERAQAGLTARLEQLDAAATTEDSDVSSLADVAAIALHRLAARLTSDDAQ